MNKVFYILVCLTLSCTNFTNSRDPSNICGGISIEDPLKFRIHSSDIISSENTNEGINLTAKVNLTNCIGFDFSNSSFKAVVTENDYFHETEYEGNIGSLNPNETSYIELNLLAKYKYLNTDREFYIKIDFLNTNNNISHYQEELVSIKNPETNIVVDSITCEPSSLDSAFIVSNCKAVLKNKGASTTGVEVILNSITMGASIVSNNVFYFDKFDGNDAIKKISFNAKTKSFLENHVLNLSISDDFNNIFSKNSSFYFYNPNSNIEIVSADIIRDSNDDGNLSAGETAYLKIKVKNNTSKTIEELTATVESGLNISFSYPYNRNYLSFGDIEKGKTACGTYNYSDDTCNNYYYNYLEITLPHDFEETKIPLMLNFLDKNGKKWKTFFSIPTTKLNMSLSHVSTEILNDTNNDKKLSSGETAYLRIKLKNTGNAKIYNLTGVLTSNNNNVSISYYSNEDKMYFGDLAIDESSCGNRNFSKGLCNTMNTYFVKLVLSPVIINGISIPFRLDLTDVSNRVWSIDFNINTVIPDVNINIQNIRLVSEQNSDGKLNSGEYGYLQIKVKNTGSANSIETTGKLTVNNSNVLISYNNQDTQFYFGNVNIGEERCGYSSHVHGSSACTTDNRNPKITIPSSVPNGTNLLFTLTLENKLQNTYTRQFNFIVGSTNTSINSNYELISDTSGDGIINPGESFYLKFILNNESIHHANNVYLSFSEIGTNYLTLTHTKAYFNELEGKTSKCGTNIFSTYDSGKCNLNFTYYNMFSISSETPIGTNISLLGTLKDKYENILATYTYLIPVR